MAIRANVIFKGRVQGVWFRASTKEVALKTGVKGWVRNLPDGSVEAVFEGPKGRVDRVVALCRSFPSPKRVDEVLVRVFPAKGDLTTFEIRY